MSKVMRFKKGEFAANVQVLLVLFHSRQFITTTSAKNNVLMVSIGAKFILIRAARIQHFWGFGHLGSCYDAVGPISRQNLDCRVGFYQPKLLRFRWKFLWLLRRISAGLARNLSRFCVVDSPALYHTAREPGRASAVYQNLSRFWYTSILVYVRISR